MYTVVKRFMPPVIHPYAAKTSQTVTFFDESWYSISRRYTKPDTQSKETATSLTARVSNCTEPQDSFLFVLRSLKNVATMRKFKTTDMHASTVVGMLYTVLVKSQRYC
jgi:hypothetical protein